jgi:F-type H+-transporting ATPase subunit epsilon
MAELHVTLISPERAAFEGEASLVAVPAFDGEIGILPGHAPLLAALGTGRLKVVTPQGPRFFAVRQGFLEVVNNRVTILAATAVAPSQIATAAVQAELQELRGQTGVRTPEEDEQRRDAIAWAQTRLKVVGSATG